MLHGKSAEACPHAARLKNLSLQNVLQHAKPHGHLLETLLQVRGIFSPGCCVVVLVAAMSGTR